VIFAIFTEVCRVFAIFCRDFLLSLHTRKQSKIQTAVNQTTRRRTSHSDKQVGDVARKTTGFALHKPFCGQTDSPLQTRCVRIRNAYNLQRCEPINKQR